MADNMQSTVSVPKKEQTINFREILISYGAIIALIGLILLNSIITKNFLSLNANSGSSDHVFR